MIFTTKPEIIDAYEQGNEFGVTQAQDIGPTLKLNRELREQDETKGWTEGRTMKHLASIPEIVESILLQERPEVFKDAKEMRKWLDTDIGKQFKVAPDAAPVKGEGLQVIVR